MNSAVEAFYKKNGKNKESFSDVIFLSDSKLDVNKLKEICPKLPLGWVELSRLSSTLRIEFACDYCLNTLPYKPKAYSFLSDFFSTKLDDVEVALTQKDGQEQYIAELVYSLNDDSGFFRGNVPASEEEILKLNQHFQTLLPRDFLAFLQIHNGFRKNFETGIFDTQKMILMAASFYEKLYKTGKVIKSGRKIIDPSLLIPFYQGMSQTDFQCFLMDWFPQEEMGSVYFSVIDNALSDYHSNLSSIESLAFVSFLDWLVFYLEEVEI